MPEALVGLADIPTGGRVGKFLENEGGSVGFRPKQAKEQVNEWHSDATKEAQRKFQEAEGLGGKFQAAIENPSNVVGAVVESLPLMGAGGVAARGLTAATKLGQMGAKGAMLAGAAGEGLTMAGSAAEQIRQETPDGLLTPTQAGLAGLTGVAGAAFGVGGGKLAQRLGIGDVDTMLAQGSKGMAADAGTAAARAAPNPLVQQQAAKSIPRQVIEGAISEGLLEELPQSLAEQIFQNVALGKDWLQDLDAAAVMGVLSGGLMGGGAAGVYGMRRAPAAAGAPEHPPGAPGEPPAAEPGAAPAQPSPAMLRIQQAYADQLAALQAQEHGEAAVPQSTPPDGAAVLAQQQAAEAARRQAIQDAQRAVTSPDDEIHDSTGANVPRSAAMGIDPAQGPLSAGAALAVDTGVADQLQQAAALAQAAELVQKEGKKPGSKLQKQEQQEQYQSGVDPETGEIWQGAPMAEWSDADLSNAFRGAQTREVRMQLAQELGRRRNQALQDELAAEQAGTVLGAERADAAFASLTEDAGPLDVAALSPQSTPNAEPNQAEQKTPASIDEQAQTATKTVANIPTTTQGVPNGAQANEAQQGSAQPPQVGAAPEVARGAPDAQGRAGAQAAAGASASKVAFAGSDLLSGINLRNPELDAQDIAHSRAVYGRDRENGVRAEEMAPSTGKWLNSFKTLDQQKSIVQTLVTRLEGGALPGDLGITFGADDHEIVVGIGDTGITHTGKRLADVDKRFKVGNHRSNRELVEEGIQVAPALVLRALKNHLRGLSNQGREQSKRAASERWARMPAAERQALAQRADLKPVVQKNVHRGAWADLNGSVQRKLADAMEPEVQAQAVAPGARPDVEQKNEAAALYTQAPAAIESGANPAASPLPAGPVGPTDVQAPANVVAPKKRAPRGILAKKAEADEKARSDYFTPGNIVKGYSGHDRVIAYFPTDERGDWSVKVQHVVQQDGEWVVDPADPRERTHATPPEPKELKAGPVVRAQPTKVAADASAQEPADFIPAPGGGLDYGEITPEMGKAMRRQAGKIRLQQGVQNADGTGFGLTHIEANHGKQIRSAGFESVERFIAHVAGSFNEVLQAAKGRQLLVAVTQGRRDVMFVQLEAAPEGDFYRVNTAFPASRDYLEKREGKGAKILWSGSEPRSAVAGQQPPYAGSPDDVSGQDAPIARGENSVPLWEGRAQPSQSTTSEQTPFAEPPQEAGEAATIPSGQSGASVPQAATAEQPSKPITDFGEKIGGARKDTAGATGSKSARPRNTDERPAWARRYEISQIATSSRVGEAGRWVVRDTRRLDAFNQPRQMGRETYATREEAEQAVPLLAVSQKHRLVPVRGGGAGYEIWRDVSDRKRVKVVEQVFPTREAALEYMVGNAQAIIETNTTFGEADLPRPPADQRLGAARRTGDARDSDFTEVFGFRGVEFGNWNNQQERQELLNDAYDGLLDLAEVMDVPPRAISLNGELALAFGARGHGLSGARAHYELDKVVTNLTKMNGAGSLAHEWFHALDHYFGRQDGKAPAEWVVSKDGTRSLQVHDAPEDDMASGGTRGDRSGMRPELREAYAEVMRTISRKAEAYVEDAARADKFVSTARQEVKQRLDDIRAGLARDLDARYYKRHNKAATAEQLAEFDSVAENIVAGELLELRVESKGAGRSITSGVRWTNDALNRLSAVMKAVRGRQGFSADQDGPLDRLRGLMQNYSVRLKMLADAQAASEKSRMVPTEFVMNAKELDQGRGQDYWTRPHELAARAFQGYVEDKIAERGGRSPFLNYGPEGAVIATPWGFKRPFPAGAERAAINKSFDKLVEVIQTREGEGGGVAMFRRESDAKIAGAAEFDVDSFLKAMGDSAGFSEAAQRPAVDSVSAVVGAIRTAWGPNAPEVVVAFDMQDPLVPEAARKADLRQRSGGAHGAPEGFYYRGKAYLLASRLTTPADAVRVLHHEVLGHHGLRGKFGRDLDLVLNQVAAMRNAEVAAKIKEYGLRGVRELSVREAAEEVLAEMAEKNPRLHFVQRAVAAIRNFLRAHVPGFRDLRMTDNDIIQAYILPARGWVERGGAAAGAGADPVFSRDEGAAEGFAQQVEVAIAAGMAGDAQALRVQVPVGIETPPALQLLGVAAKPVYTHRDLIAKMHFEHGVPRSALKGLDKLLSDPVLVFKSDTQPGRFVVVTSLVLGGNPVVVAVDPNGKSGRAEVVYLPSAYPKDNADRVFTKWIQGGLLQYANKEESRRLATTARLQLPGVVQRAIGFRADYMTEADLPASGDGDLPVFSRARLQDLKSGALAQVEQAMSHPGKVSLWDKTVGTMRHLGERSPAFKPVYEAAQRFIDDVSMLANDAADQAPRLLPRVEALADLKKKPITAAENKAVAKPLFEGTLLWARDVDGTPVTTDALNDKYRNATPDEKAQILLRTGKIQAQMLKVWRGLPLDQFNAIINNKFDSTVLKPGLVWTAKELSELFGLNAQQVSLYQEARAAIDRSIDMTARADMLRALGERYAPMRDAVLEQDTLEDAMKLLTDTLQDEAREYPDTADRALALNNAVVKSYERATELQAAGYAPLSRFGRYTVDVVGQDGTREYFGMFETMREANQMAERMRGEFKGATVTQGTMSDEAFKLFQGITPESLEQFGHMLGLDEAGENAKDKAFQAYLQLAKNNHSALKRLIHRKGISGYSEDVGRVLASFVYSNARLAAGGLNAGTMETAIEAIPKEQGELRDVAMGLRSYIQDPQEEGQAVRGMLFAQYLGGSLASAAVNMTQPFQITMPWLSQFGGVRSAAAHLAGALRDMARGGHYETDLAQALHAAEVDGVVSPQEIHQLMAQARGTGSLRTGDGTRVGDARAAAANHWERVKVAWGQPFALAEQFNRRSTFIAAYRMAKEQGMDAPAEFARRAVVETQFVYSKANKMRWGRGAVGGTLMTFKTYSVSYLELMHRMWTQGGPEGKRAVAWAVAMLVLMGGAGGLPFMTDAEDLIDGAGQLMGYNLSSKQWRKDVLRDVLGKELADFVEEGVSGLPGAPIDVSGRLGMGNLIPGTGLLLTKQNRERDLLEVAGPAGDLIARGFTGARKALTGDVAGAALEVSPTAIRNLAKGIDMAGSGIYKDTKGYKVIDTTLDEAIAKAIGFQPHSVAEVQQSNSFMQRSKSFYVQTSSEIKAQWAQALFDKDDAALERARERLADWNRNNPDQPIVVKMPDIWKKVREMGKDRTQRIADTAPKALRQQMREMARENG